jgi:hypothetical protein
MFLLGVDLSTEMLTTDYNALKEQYDDMTKREQQARKDGL